MGFFEQNSLVLIKQGKVRVNYMEISKNDFRLKAGDIISLRGKGKAKVISMDERTKRKYPFRSGSIYMIVKRGGLDAERA